MVPVARQSHSVWYLAAIASREVTYDLARMMEPPVNPPLKCSEFAEAIVKHFDD